MEKKEKRRFTIRKANWERLGALAICPYFVTVSFPRKGEEPKIYCKPLEGDWENVDAKIFTTINSRLRRDMFFEKKCCANYKTCESYRAREAREMELERKKQEEAKAKWEAERKRKLLSSD